MESRQAELQADNCRARHGLFFSNFKTSKRIDMPFVFIHGVNTRAGAAYDKGVAARHQLLSQTTFPQLAFSHGNQLKFFDPYWGGAGAVPLWKNRSMPRYGVNFAAMGSAEGAVVDTISTSIDFGKDEKAAVLKIAKKNGLTAALDVLVLQVVREGESDQGLREISKAGSAILAYAKNNEYPEWLNEVEDDETFVYKLGREVEKREAPTDSAAMGLGDVWERLKESAGRIGSSVDDKTSELIVRAAREKIQEQATLFLGDAFVYFNNRWTNADAGGAAIAKRDGLVSGKIPNIVLQALIDAEKGKSNDDPYLIVMAHSMGGNIIYDLCTDFLKHVVPEIKVDLLITVGSQFSMFQEINMFKGVKLREVIGDDTRISKPACIKHWINCFDKNDIFGYNASAVFKDVQDFEYDTGFGVGGAHGGYFERFSFYDRLGKRIGDLLPVKSVAAGVKP
jgi:hypothetical protein